MSTRRGRPLGSGYKNQVKIMKFFRESGVPLYAQQIYNRIKSKRAMYESLAILISQGFLEKVKKGKYIVYSLTSKAKDELSPAENRIYPIEFKKKFSWYYRLIYYEHTEEEIEEIEKYLNSMPEFYNDALEDEEVAILYKRYNREINRLKKRDPIAFKKMTDKEIVAFAKQLNYITYILEHGHEPLKGKNDGFKKKPYRRLF